ncbi:MAG TPA: hypothetical protein VFA60_04145 [Terriglobales bacterium]|nr:hypothetical protein [Terriglobales bacterium]
MRTRHFRPSLGWVLLLFTALVSCQKAETPTQAAAPAPPPPPPQTSQGKLVRAELSPKTKVRVMYLTVNGLKTSTDDKEAAKGKTWVVLHFDDKPPLEKKKSDGVVKLSSSGDRGRLEAKDNSATDEPNLFLTDAAGAKYTDWYFFQEKNSKSARIAFEVPQGAGGLVFHDGADKAYPIQPVAAAPAPAPAAAGSAK